MADRTAEQGVDGRASWPDSLWVWTGVDGLNNATEAKPPRNFAARRYFLHLTKHELYKRAGLDEGLDAMRYCANLEQIIANQTAEIRRLREKQGG